MYLYYLTKLGNIVLSIYQNAITIIVIHTLGQIYLEETIDDTFFFLQISNEFH